MDPVSISAAIVAFIGASSSVAGCLEEISSLRKVPSVILALNNEISDLRLLFYGLEELTWQSSDPVIASSTIVPTLERAKAKVLELEIVLEYQIIVRHSSNHEIKIDWIAWLRNKKKVQEIHREFRDVKLNIATSLGAVSSLSSLRLHARLQDLQHITREAQAEQQNRSLIATQAYSRHEQMCMAAFSHIIQAQRQTKDGIEPVDGAIARPSLVGSGSTNAAKASSSGKSHGTPGEFMRSGSLRVSTSVAGPCLLGCRCICHRRKMTRSSEFLEGIMGALFVGYVGIPLLSSSCDKPNCKYSTTSGISINYFFPTWFVRRVLFFTLGFGCHEDPEPGLGLPRVRPDDALIFEYAVKGSIHGVKWLLESGRASPYDVNPRGRSPLTLALVAGKMEICRIFLQAGADPYQEDPTYGCAYDYAWRKTFSGGKDGLTLAELRLLFSEDEYLDTHELTFLQRAVIGINPISIESVLENMPFSEINGTDADGRTALIWAATRGNYRALDLLLQRGASHKTIVRNSLTALTEASISGNEHCVKLLLEAGANVNYTNSRGYTSLHEAARSHDNSAVIKVLLDHGANINALTKWNATPLMYATHNMNHRTAVYLIEHGADYELRDLDGVSALCYSIWKNDLVTLRFLLEKRADHTVITNNGMSVLHYAAWDGDVHTIKILTDARLKRLDVSAIARGVTALEAAEQRQDKAWDLSDQWFEAFKGLWESVQPNGILLSDPEISVNTAEKEDSDEDVFEDAFEQQEIPC